MEVTIITIIFISLKNYTIFGVCKTLKKIEDFYAPNISCLRVYLPKISCWITWNFCLKDILTDEILSFPA